MEDVVNVAGEDQRPRLAGVEYPAGRAKEVVAAFHVGFVIN
jgi:hypothetical protein